MFTVISTRGDATDVDAWVNMRLLPALRGAEISVSSNVVQCDSFDGLTYNVLDWSEVDAIVDLLGELAQDDGVAVEVAITIAPEPGVCPSIGCGV